MALSMIGLRGGDATPTRRTTANNLHAVVAGSGSTDVNGERFNWQRHAHTAAEAAVLFRVSDEPVGSGSCAPPTERPARIASRSMIAVPRRQAASLDVSS